MHQMGNKTVMRNWALSLVPEKLYNIMLRCYLSSTNPSPQDSTIYVWKVGEKILTDSEVVDESIVAMFYSLNIPLYVEIQSMR